MIFCFGQSQHERIDVDVLRYERAPTGEYHDDNWLTVEIQICVGGFRGKTGAAILTGELVAFMSQLRPLFETLQGSAQFATLEEQLILRLTGDGKGHIQLHGEMADQPGIGNRLYFTLQFDKSQLGESIRALETVISKFPVRVV
jgi:hypothetical protein